MFMNRSELPIPPDAKKDREAAELLRVWFAHGRPQVSLANGVWEEPEPWGMLLADLAEYVANTYAELGGRDRTEVLRQIRKGLDAQWPAPVD